MRRQNLRVLPYTGERDYQFYLDGLKVNGKRKRLFFKSKKEADREFERLTRTQRKEGEAGLNLSDSVRGLALECTGLLSKYPGQTILDATRFYIKHLEAVSSSISVEILVSGYLETKIRAQLSQRHLDDIHQRLGRFQEAFSGRAVRTLSTSELEEWLQDLELSPRSSNNYRTVVCSLLGHAVRRGFLDRNPALEIGKIKIVGVQFRSLPPMHWLRCWRPRQLHFCPPWLSGPLPDFGLPNCSG